MNEPAENPDELTLSAFIDGELTAEEEARVTARLTTEPALAARLKELRGADADARRLYLAIDDQPTPQAVLDLLDAGEPAAALAEAQVISFPSRMLRDFWQTPVAIAASVALVAGYLVNSLFDQRLPTNTQPSEPLAAAVAPGSDLHRLLETGISARPVDLGSDRRGRLLLTFQDRAGDYCRQVRLDDSAGSLQALACRRDGAWRNEVWSFGQALDASADYQQASTDISPVIQAAVGELLGDQPPLGIAEEQQLIGRGWKKTDD